MLKKFASFVSVIVLSIIISHEANASENEFLAPYLQDNTYFNILPIEYKFDRNFDEMPSEPNAEILPLEIRTNAGVPTYSSKTDLKAYLINEISKLNTEINIEYTDTSINMMDLLNEIVYTDNFASGVVTRYGYSRTGTKYKFKFTYTLTAEQQSFVSSEVNRIVGQIIKPSMSDAEKVVAIHDYIVKNTNYKLVNSNGVTTHSAYSLFKYGTGVCQAYAMAAYEMLKKAGLEVHYVTGTGNGAYHAWNLVKVDGEWFHLDTTFDDPTVTYTDYPNIKNFTSYKYFLISDRDIKKDHTIDTNYRTYPKATSDRFKAVHAAEYKLMNYNSLKYTLSTSTANQYVYAIDKDNNYSIVRFNLNQKPVTKEVIYKSSRALNVAATANDVFFINADNSYGVSKVNLSSKQATHLYKGEIIKYIELKNNKLYSYNDKGTSVFTVDAFNTTSPQAQEVIDLIKAINKDGEDFIVKVKEVDAKYAALSDIDKAAVTNAKTLEDYKKQVQTLENQIKSIESKINNLSTQMALTDLINRVNEIKQEIATAHKAVKKGIKNLDKLSQIEKFIADNQAKYEQNLKQIADKINTLTELIS